MLENNGGHTKSWHFGPKLDIITFVASGLDMNGCVLLTVSYFERTANLHCYTSGTLTTLHCSKVSFLKCHKKIYNKIFTNICVYSLLWDTVDIYIYFFFYSNVSHFAGFKIYVQCCTIPKYATSLSIKMYSDWLPCKIFKCDPFIIAYVTRFKNSPRDLFAFVCVGLNLDLHYNTYLKAFSFSGFIFATSTMIYSNTFILGLR